MQPEIVRPSLDPLKTPGAPEKSGTKNAENPLRDRMFCEFCTLHDGARSTGCGAAIRSYTVHIVLAAKLDAVTFSLRRGGVSTGGYPNEKAESTDSHQGLALR